MTPPRVLAIDWDFEAPGLHRFLQPYLEPASAERFRETPACLKLFEHLRSKRSDFDPEDFVGNRTRAKSTLAELNLQRYLLASRFNGLFVMKAGQFDHDCAFPNSIGMTSFETPLGYSRVWRISSAPSSTTF